MAKQPKIPEAEVRECVEQAMAASEHAAHITAAIRKLNIVDVPDVLAKARAILGFSRDLSECALAMMDQHNLQEQRREIEKGQAELDELRKK